MYLQVFIRATIYTSIEEPIFDEDPVIEHRPVRDVSESSRWVPITFGPVVAKFIKVSTCYETSELLWQTTG